MLERVADLATNIAEEVVFIAEARIIKHHAEDEFGRTQDLREPGWVSRSGNTHPPNCLS